MNSETNFEYILRKAIFTYVPVEAQLCRIEFEGPYIVLYVKNPAVLIDRPEIIRNVAKVVKKRIKIRVPKNARLRQEEAEKIIRELAAKAEIERVVFDKVTGEAYVYARKPGYVIGEGGEVKKEIIKATGWIPIPVRVPSLKLKSSTFDWLYNLLINQSSYRLNFLNEIGLRIHRPVLYKDKDTYIRITALGGFQEVGRSAILIQTKESKILLDAGIKPTSGARDELPYFDIPEFDPEDLDAVIITHAHLDHCGSLPYLFKHGYKGPVYTTEPTRTLMALLLKDYLEVSMKQKKKCLYSLNDIQTALLHVIPLEFGEVTDIAPDVRLTLHPAGHILGSAIVHLHIGNGLCNVVYTGDFKYGRTRLLDMASYRFPRVEVLIMESTYGGREDIMPRREDTEKALIHIVKETISKGGKVLIPVLAVGRGQEIILVLEDAIKEGKLPKVPIFVDGMVYEATAIHVIYPEYLSRSLQEKIFKGYNPFEAENIHIIKSPQEREEVIMNPEPCIILASSGMLTGGPVLEYFYALAEDSKNTLIFVSYQIEGTLGRRILDAHRLGQTIQIPKHVFSGLRGIVYGGKKMEYITVKMRIEALEGFSGHSDRKQLIAFTRNIRPRPRIIIINHGEKSKISDLALSLSRIHREAVILTPQNLETVRVR